jgi:hypothetical protein
MTLCLIFEKLKYLGQLKHVQITTTTRRRRRRRTITLCYSQKNAKGGLWAKGRRVEQQRFNFSKNFHPPHTNCGSYADIG